MAAIPTFSSMPVPIGVVTVSDRVSRGQYQDQGGPAVVAELTRILYTPWRPDRWLVPDEQPLIEAALVDLADRVGCGLIITTGGAGPTHRDVTPEATAAVCDRILPGFGEMMRTISLKSVPAVILSRQTAGIRGRTLILNLPGKPASIAECLGAVFPAIPYCLELIGGPRLETHEAVVRAFRPNRLDTAQESP